MMGIRFQFTKLAAGHGFAYNDFFLHEADLVKISKADVNNSYQSRGFSASAQAETIS